MEELISLLLEQNRLLKRLIDLQTSPVLGFTDRAPGMPVWVFVGRNADFCFYTLDDANNPIPMTQRAITGFITSIAVDKKAMRRGKETSKLNISIRADHNYTISTGYDTCFGRSFLASLSVMERQSFAAPISLQAVPGEDESVVWCRVYAPEYVKSPTWDERTNWDAIAATVISNFQVTGESKAPNVVEFPSQSSLFPKHNSFIKRLRNISGHHHEWVAKACQRYGASEPGLLNPDKLRELVMDMAVDYGYNTGYFSDRNHAARAYSFSISKAEEHGKRWGEGVLAFFMEINRSVS